jgi:hypothetical protein
MICKRGGDCPFYKTKEQFREDAENARAKNNMRGKYNVK